MTEQSGQADDVARAIALALLEKTADEQARLSGEVEKILAFVSEVQSVATDDAGDGAARGEERVNVFRDDAVTVEAGRYRDAMLARAPASFKQWFLSKKIL